MSEYSAFTLLLVLVAIERIIELVISNLGVRTINIWWSFTSFFWWVLSSRFGLRNLPLIQFSLGVLSHLRSHRRDFAGGVFQPWDNVGIPWS